MCKLSAMDDLEPKAFAARLRSIGISASYASQIANRKRQPSLSTALDIHRHLQVKIGPLVGVVDSDLPALARLAEKERAS